MTQSNDDNEDDLSVSRSIAKMLAFSSLVSGGLVSGGLVPECVTR